MLAGITVMIAALGAAPARAAAPSGASSVTVTVDRLILDPGDRGYRGTLAFALEYRGSRPTYFNLWFTEPVAGSFIGIQPSDVCGWDGTDAAGRRMMWCGVPGGDLLPGRQHRFALDFQVLTTPQSYAMTAPDSVLTVQSGSDATVSGSAPFGTLFRSTSGSLDQPQPYVQDTRSDISVVTGDATLTRQTDGTFAGRTSVTVRHGDDAPHFELSAQLDLPAAVHLDDLDPSDVCMGSYCAVPGGKFMEGEVRTFDLLLSAPADTPAGTIGSGSVTVTASWLTEITDVYPADNTAAFAVTVAP